MEARTEIKIGTRGSALALTQTNLVIGRLAELDPHRKYTTVTIKTLGDKKQGTPLASNGDKKDWILELEQAVLRGEIDLAIHSGKDIPADVEAGTSLLPVLERATPFDVFIGRRGGSARIKFSELPEGARVGTASLRRRAQLLRFRPDLKVVELRGNIQTRIRKLDEDSALDGIVLAAAGLQRMAFGDLECELLSGEALLPAVNQGILVAQYREGDLLVAEALGNLSRSEEIQAMKAERACVMLLGADCKSAVAVFAVIEGDQLKITGRVLHPDGSRLIEDSYCGAREDAEMLGTRLAEALIARGAEDLIAESRTFSFTP